MAVESPDKEALKDLTFDAHTHCGLTLPFRDLADQWDKGGISGGVAFSPVEEVYNRYDPRFADSDEYRRSRSQVHDYLLVLASQKRVFPYFFVWNDFSPVPDGFMGIKWHRHYDEPEYDYDSKGCERIFDEICSRRLPVVLEEEFSHTLDFVERIAQRTVVIIPHLGALNGGYYRLKKTGIFENPFIWVDTALAAPLAITDYAENYGNDRILFGSDYPFGVPAVEKQKVVNLFSGRDLFAILGGNLLRLLKISD